MTETHQPSGPKTDRIIEEAKRHIAADEQRLLNNDFQPSFTFYTDDSEVPRLIVMPDMDGSDEMRSKVAWSLRLISASIDNLDCIAFSVDTYAHKSQAGNLGPDGKPPKPTKLDGSDWGHGEMQHAWKNSTPDKALITEAYTYQIAYSDGTFAMLSVPYTKDEAAGTITFDWDDVMPFVTDEGEGGGVGGFFPEAMFRALTETKMIDAMLEQGLGELTPEKFGLEQWQARLHTMAVAVKMVLKQTQWPCMIPGRSQEEADVINDSFQGGPFTEGIRTFDQDQVAEIGALEEQFEQPVVGTPEWLQGLHKGIE